MVCGHCIHILYIYGVIQYSVCLYIILLSSSCRCCCCCCCCCCSRCSCLDIHCLQAITLGHSQDHTQASRKCWSTGKWWFKQPNPLGEGCSCQRQKGSYLLRIIQSRKMGMKSDVELMFDGKKYLIFATQPFKMDGENKNGMIHCRHPSHPPVIPGEVRCEFGTPFQDGDLCLLYSKGFVKINTSTDYSAKKLVVSWGQKLWSLQLFPCWTGIFEKATGVHPVAKAPREI